MKQELSDYLERQIRIMGDAMAFHIVLRYQWLTLCTDAAIISQEIKKLHEETYV